MISEEDFRKEIEPELLKMRDLLIKHKIPYAMAMELGDTEKGKTNISIGAATKETGCEESVFIDAVLFAIVAIVKEMKSPEDSDHNDSLFFSNQVGRA